MVPHATKEVRCDVCLDDGWIAYPTWADAEKKMIRIQKVACPHGCPIDPNEKGVLATYPPEERVQ